MGIKRRRQITGLGERVPEEAVASLLQLIAAGPHRRMGDGTENNEDQFASGACQRYRGGLVFTFSDGTRAEVAAPFPALSLTIRFADGRVVNIQQSPW